MSGRAGWGGACGWGPGGERESQKGPLSALHPAHRVAQVLRLVEAQAAHFQQGHEELGRLARYRRELGAQVGPRRAVVGTGWASCWWREGRGL